MDDKQGETQLLKFSKDADIKEFFYDEIKSAQSASDIKLSENVEFYLVQLLCNFIKIGQHTAIDECLANLLKKAVESLPAEQIATYKKLADNALYFSGFYQEYFAKKTFSIKYYIQMGQSAYHTLSTLMSKNTSYHKTMANIYKEMSSSFLDSVDILLCVSERTSSTHMTRPTLNIYETWIDTQSAKLEKELLNHGIIPLPNLIKKVQ